MLNVDARNVNEALPLAVHIFRQKELLIETTQRGQKRWALPSPFATTYHSPRERVLFSSVRDCNPFFHLMESLWIIAGRSDTEWICQFLPRLKDFSDGGFGFHGAYGERIRKYDQLKHAIERLKKDPDNTRSVLQIYDAERDTDYTGKDMPCNTTVYLGVQNNRLNLTVCNRSNDLIWGAYGANVVQFSMLQEYIAAHLQIEVGKYVQFSNNTHIYPDEEATQRCLKNLSNIELVSNSYDSVSPYPVVNDPKKWDRELFFFMEKSWNKEIYEEPFLRYVAVPLRLAHQAYKNKNYEMAKVYAGECAAEDWKKACLEWMERRIEKKREAA